MTITIQNKVLDYNKKKNEVLFLMYLGNGIKNIRFQVD